MTNEQEIRAKALEIAVRLINEQDRPKFIEIHTKYEHGGNMTNEGTVNISLLRPYFKLAEAIEKHIRGE
jgi:hypothetical protein